jgi:hypothetical protein
MTLDKIRTGTGRRFRTEGLQETALPIPYDAAAMPGATVLGTDGKCYQSVKDSQVDSYSWRQLLAYVSGGVLLVGGTRTRQISGSNGGYLIQIEKTGNETPIAGLSVLRRIESSSGPQLTLALDRTDANGNTVPLELDDTLGGLHFAGELNESGDAPFTRAAIRAKIDEIQSNSARSTALYFFTRISASSSSPLAERCRITSGGNFLIGNTTGTERLSVTGNIQLTEATGSYKVGTNNVVGSRKPGWAAPTGTATRTTFGTTTVTTEQLAERVKALIDDLASHGLIGA